MLSLQQLTWTSYTCYLQPSVTQSANVSSQLSLSPLQVYLDRYSRHLG